ncbi:MAG: class I SAM-dependent methyltransferase [Patescibacteria group bacterium]
MIGKSESAKGTPKPKGAAQPVTSWGNVASWYDDYLSNPDSYQEKVVLPNLMRIISPRKGERILDLACGQGFFSGKFADVGAKVTGVDISSELVTKARARLRDIDFSVAPAHKLPFANTMFDTVICVLAIQNIAEIDQTFAECKRVLKPGGRFVMVLNHPAFRVPQSSDWSYDEKTKTQGRLVTKYLSESKNKIDMHPGADKKTFTISFHRPLQVFVKLLSKNNFAVTRLEEWISHKVSKPGPRANAEDKARKEIPLFMCIETKLIS